MILPHFEVHHGEGADADRPYMMLVHGFLSSRSQWRINLPALTGVCRPVLVELLGHGRSPAPAEDSPYRAEAYLEAFEAIRARVGAERWVVCGQSFGAGLAMRYTIEHRPRVMGLIVTNSISALSPPGDPKRAASQRERIEALAKGGNAALSGLRIHPRQAKRFPPEIKTEMLADAEMISVDAVLRSMRVTSPSLSMTPRLGEIAVPTLLVNGTWEKAFQPMRARMQREMRNLRIADLPGGHSVNIEAAAGFEAAVAAFVGELQDREAAAQ